MKDQQYAKILNPILNLPLRESVGWAMLQQAKQPDLALGNFVENLIMTTELVTANDNLNNEIAQWGCQYLSAHGYILKSQLPENVKNTPWSYVVRFATSDGYIYLKHTPNLLALEANITQILRNQFHALVPDVIAHNTALNCFLMKDAGRPLREILQKQFDTALLCKAINQFTTMQLAVADHVNIFLDLGVPDWRLDKIPDLYKELLSQKDILLADGLSDLEINKLEMQLPIVANLCEKLSDYSIKPTIVQSDFHDNNMLFDSVSQNINIITSAAKTKPSPTPQTPPHRRNTPT